MFFYVYVQRALRAHLDGVQRVAVSESCHLLTVSGYLAPALACLSACLSLDVSFIRQVCGWCYLVMVSLGFLALHALLYKSIYTLTAAAFLICNFMWW